MQIDLKCYKITREGVNNSGCGVQRGKSQAGKQHKPRQEGVKCQMMASLVEL